MLKEKFKNTTVSKETMDRHFALAVQHKDEFFEQLVEMGADVNINYGQALAMAMQDNNLERMELLLKHGANPTLLQSYALKVAAATENLEALRTMYQYVQDTECIEGKDLDYDELLKLTWCNQDIYYQSLPGVAIATNNLEIAKYVLLQNVGGEYAQRNNLLCAIKTGNLEMIKLVFESPIIDDDIMREALFSNSREIIEFMMSHCGGKFPDDTIELDYEVATILNLAAKGCCETLKYLIKMPEDARGVYGETWKYELELALKAAIKWRQIEAIQLLSQYAVLEEKIKAEEMFTTKGKDDVYSVVKILIDYQIIKDYQEIAKEASGRGRTDILELLQNSGITYDYVGALGQAIIANKVPVVKYLLENTEIVLTPEVILELLRYRGQVCEKNYEVIKMLLLKEEESSKKVSD